MYNLDPQIEVFRVIICSRPVDRATFKQFINEQIIKHQLAIENKQKS